MKNEELEIEQPDGSTVTYVFIDRGNGEYTSMLKSTWDELQAKQTEGGLN